MGDRSILRYAPGLWAGLVAGMLTAQAPFERVYATGSAGALLKDTDSAIYQLGGFYDPAGAAAYVIKSRPDGQTLWQKQYPLTSWGQTAAVRTAGFDPDGSIRMLLVLSNATPPCFGILHIDTAGAVLALDQYQVPSDFLAVGLAHTPDGSSYIASSTFSVVKLNAAGDVQWAKHQIAQGSIFTGTDHDDAGDILYTSSGRLLVNTTSWRDNDEFPPTAQVRQTVHELDTAGTIVQTWSWRDTTGAPPVQVGSPGWLCELPGGGLLVTGRTSGSAGVPLVLQLDPSLNIQWVRVIEPPGCGTLNTHRIAPDANGDVIVGYRMCIGGDDGYTRLSSTGAHLGSLKLHSTSLPASVAGIIPMPDGQVLFSGTRHHLFSIDQPYFMNVDGLTTACASSPISPVVYTMDLSMQPVIPYTTNNIAVTRIALATTPVVETEAYPGCLPTSMDETAATSRLSVVPSVAQEQVKVTTRGGTAGMLRLMDPRGGLVRQWRDAGTELIVDVRDLTPGIYTVVIGDGSRSHARFVVMR